MPLDYANYPDMIVGGNLDLTKRPQVKNPQMGGRISSVWSMTASFEEKGKEVHVLIPRISPKGDILSESQAIERYRATGEHMGKFRSLKEADRYSRDYSKSLDKK
jgi:hypothetical protein